MPEIVKLNKENFIKQIVEFGYFAEQIPSCFSTQLLLQKIDEILPIINTGNNQLNNTKKHLTSPTTLSTYKDELSRRALSIPNPIAFLRLAKFMSENLDEILEFAESKNSLSPVTYIYQYEAENAEMLNSENLRESKKTKSDYIEGIKKCIRISLGYKYRLQVDIANCYNSIYTHSISWAICEKYKAKLYYRTNEPEDIKDKYKLSEKLDKFTGYQKNNETNGIVVGPFTANIRIIRRDTQE